MVIPDCTKTSNWNNIVVYRQAFSISEIKNNFYFSTESIVRHASVLRKEK